MPTIACRVPKNQKKKEKRKKKKRKNQNARSLGRLLVKGEEGRLHATQGHEEEEKEEEERGAFYAKASFVVA